LAHPECLNHPQTFAPTIASGLNTPQARIRRVLDAAFQNAVIDPHIAASGITLVIAIERVAPFGNRGEFPHRRRRD